MQSGRLGQLMARKAQIEAEIHQEHNRMLPDQIRVTQLKRRKLLVKEEIERLSQAS